jgi:hypothetical protein
VNGELEGSGRFLILLRLSPGRTEENHGKTFSRYPVSGPGFEHGTY